MEQAERFVVAVTVEEGILFGIAQGFSELLDDIAFQVECIVIQQLVGDLHTDRQLVGIDGDLSECRIGEGQLTALLYPQCSRLGGCHIDLMQTGCGQLVAECSHDVVLGQYIHQSGIVLFRNKVAAIRIHTFLQEIGYLSEVGAECCDHVTSVLVGCSSGLFLRLSCLHRFSGQRSIDGLGQCLFHLLFSLHPLDLSCEIRDLLFHVLIGAVVLIGHGAVFCSVAFRKVLCCFPRFLSLFHHL